MVSEVLGEVIRSAVDTVRKVKRVSFFPDVTYQDSKGGGQDPVVNCLPINVESVINSVIYPLMRRADNIYVYNYEWNEDHPALNVKYWRELKSRLDSSLVKTGKLFKMSVPSDLVDGLECFWFRSKIPVGLFRGLPVFEYSSGSRVFDDVFESVYGPSFVSGARSGFKSAINRANAIADTGGVAVIWWGAHFEIYAKPDELEEILENSFQRCFRFGKPNERWRDL